MIAIIILLEFVMRKFRTKAAEDRGAALVSSLLALMLMAAITAGFMALVVTDTRVRSMDNTRTQAFYVAHAGLEKMTSDLGDLFAVNFAPTAAQINALANTPPALPGVTWLKPDGTDGYTTTFPAGGGGNPQASVMTVMSGPFQGLVGLATPFQMSVTARLSDGSEANLTRTLQTVAIPVFQFGLFSENDLSFFAGPNFNFGGRVHSNANVYLAEGDGNTLTMADKVTAVGELIRTNLSNGWDTNNNYNGTVRAITAPGAFRNLAKAEGSLVGTVGSATNEPTWTNLSTGTYNHNIANSRTGAKRLDLPVVSFGGAPIDIIRRPAVNENVANPNLLAERFFSLASVRILLSDVAADITNLPGVTATAPVPLGSISPWALDATHLPFADSPGLEVGGVGGDCTFAAGNTIQAARCGSRTPGGSANPLLNTPLMGGFIKIEMVNAAGVWTDVTMEILNLGITGKQIDVAGCVSPSPNAVIRIQHLRDKLKAAACVTVAGDGPALWSGANAPFNYSPNVLYDTREGILRDGVAAAAPMQYGGIIHYVELDVNNLRRWLTGAIGVTGNQALSVNGFTVYFSDRRGNHNGAGAETGEYGFEDVVNPLSATGTPNGLLDVGEDFNLNGTLETYGQNPLAPPLNPGGVAQLWALLAAPINTNLLRPWSNVDPAAVKTVAERSAIAQRNPAVFFRRALKITNGALGNIVTPGLAIASENPVYVQGNWNANDAGYGDPHAATSILCDAMTLLSNAWNDKESFDSPHDKGPRNATTTWYRMAVIAGKGPSFPQPGVGAPPQDYGTDGGAHNFLRYIEDWGGQTLNYRGSIASMYFTRQATGTYKCCTDVYSPPTRGYNFDVDFLTPALLPPRTPMFRDVNTTGFAQIIRPQ
jgi:hypothetical protein